MFTTEWLEKSLAYLPWLMLVAALLPTILLAFIWRIFPTNRWLYLFGPITLFSLLTVWMPSLAFFVVVLDALAVVLVVVDLLVLTRPCRLRVERVMTKVASLAKPHDVVLHLSNLASWPQRMDVRDDQPDGLTAEPPEHTITIPAGKPTD